METIYPIDPREFYFIENAHRKGDVAGFKQHVTEAGILYARGKTQDGREMSVAEVIMSNAWRYTEFLDALVENGITPADPKVDQTGLFRIGTILNQLRNDQRSDTEICALLDRYLALAPEADLRNLAGIHPVRILWGSGWGAELMSWAVARTPNLKAMDAERPLLSMMGYDSSMSTFVQAKVLMEAGANANWTEDNEYEYTSNALFWLLQSMPIPLPLLYLFISHGASDPTFLFQLISIRKKKMLPHLAAIASAYLDVKSNRAQLKLTDPAGYSPLHYAVMKQDPALVASLVAGGADIHIAAPKSRKLFKVKAPKGSTPMSIATQLGHPDLLNALQGKYPAVIANLADLQSTLSAPDPLQNKFRQSLQHLADRPGIEWLAKPSMQVAAPDKITLKMMDQSWPKRSESHLELLKIAWWFGGQACSWRIGDRAGGAFRIADWSDMVSRNLLCYHEDIGRTYFKISKSGVQLFFHATYESYTSFPLRLSLQEYMERLFQLGGMPYWTYFYFKDPKPYVKKLPFFREGLAALQPQGDVSHFEKLMP